MSTVILRNLILPFSGWGHHSKRPLCFVQISRSICALLMWGKVQPRQYPVSVFQFTVNLEVRRGGLRCTLDTVIPHPRKNVRVKHSIITSVPRMKQERIVQSCCRHRRCSANHPRLQVFKSRSRDCMIPFVSLVYCPTLFATSILWTPVPHQWI